MNFDQFIDYYWFWLLISDWLECFAWYSKSSFKMGIWKLEKVLLTWTTQFSRWDSGSKCSLVSTGITTALVQLHKAKPSYIYFMVFGLCFISFLGSLSHHVQWHIIPLKWWKVWFYPILSLVQCTHVVKLFPNLGANDFLLHLFWFFYLTVNLSWLNVTGGGKHLKWFQSETIWNFRQY